jgi:hypothetical protein
MVLYTGKESKLFLNQGQYKFKISKLAYMLNIFLIINLSILCFIIVLDGYVGTLNWMQKNSSNMYYIFPEKTVDSVLYSEYSMAS